MDSFFDLFSYPFVWGLLIGLSLLVMSLYSHWKTSREFLHYKRHLSDKMELDAELQQKMKAERDRLAGENENLRILVASLKEKPDPRLAHELELLSRAESQMLLNAPGFGAAWEAAKHRAHEELAEESQGRSLPKRIFRKFFGGGKEIHVDQVQALEYSGDEGNAGASKGVSENVAGGAGGQR